MSDTTPFDRDEAWKAFDRLAKAVADLGAPYHPTCAALDLVKDARNYVFDAIGEAWWGCETCEGFIWSDDGRAVTDDDGCHMCGACVARMEVDGEMDEEVMRDGE